MTQVAYFYTLGGLRVSPEVFWFLVGLAVVMVVAGLVRLIR